MSVFHLLVYSHSKGSSASGTTILSVSGSELRTLPYIIQRNNHITKGKLNDHKLSIFGGGGVKFSGKDAPNNHQTKQPKIIG